MKKLLLLFIIWISFTIVNKTKAQLTIVRTDATSINTLLASDKASIDAAFDYAALQFTSRFSDPIQINITIAAVTGTGTLGQSSTQLVGTETYAQIKTALTNDAKTSYDNTAITNLPSSDPAPISPSPPNVASHYLLARAEAKALGLIATDATKDGTFTFGAGFSYTYDPNNRTVAGKIDFIGVAMHEISEIMGRISLLGANLTGAPNYIPYDLFRFTGSNTPKLQDASGVYFSINNGATNLKNYNFANGNGSDPQDWASGVNDAFNAFSSSSVLNDLTNVDIIAMDVIGYDLKAGVLPLTLVDFSGVLKNNQVILNWKVQNQINVDNYTVERSFDGQNFTAIGDIKATLNPPLTENFTFTDLKNDKPISFYRLKMIDLNGKFVYSSIVEIINNKQPFSAELIQNPVHDNISINLNNQLNQNIQIALINSAGQQIKTWNLGKVNGLINLPIINLHLASGLYIVNIWINGKFEPHKLVVN